MDIKYLILLGFLLYAVYTDMTQTRISNRLIVLGLLTGFLFCIVGEESAGVFIFLINIFIPVVLLYLLFQMRALGAGDIKLFSMLGAFISTKELLKVMVLAFVVGSMLGIFKILYQWIFLRLEIRELTKIHFSPAILIAYVIMRGGLL